MRIGIIGTGNIGATLTRRLTALGPLGSTWMEQGTKLIPAGEIGTGTGR